MSKLLRGLFSRGFNVVNSKSVKPVKISSNIVKTHLVYTDNTEEIIYIAENLISTLTHSKNLQSIFYIGSDNI